MGQRVGPYEVQGELGRGAFGAVLRAREPATGEAVALKLLLRGRDAPATARERFAREARALERLRHPGIVSVRATGEAQGVPWIAMDLVDGESLERRLRSGPLPEAEAARVALGVARALAHAHENEVLHRDVKPSNVLLDAAGEPRLSDFGLAKELDATGASLTRSGVVLGTPGYCAPEQVSTLPGERSAIGPPADVYGLGATLYAALTGAAPIEGESVVELLLATASRPPTRPSAHRPGLDAGLEALVLRCLEKEPARRPTAADVVAELERWLSAASPRRRRRARSRRLRVALAAALGVVGAIAGVATRSDRVPPAPPSPPPPSPPPPAPPPPPSASAPSTALLPPDAPVSASAKEAAQELVQAGLAAEQRRDLAAAERCYRQALERWPGSAHAAFGLGNMLERRGDYPAALEAYGRAVAVEPGRAILWAGRGLARSKAGDLKGSVADLEQAHALDPDDADVLVILGGVRTNLGDGVGALLALDEALRLRPRLVSAWYNRAHAKRMLGDLPGAVGDIEQALRLEPGSAQSHLMKGVLRFDQGDVAAAEECHTRAVEAGGGADPLACRAVCRFEREDLGGAVQDARAALSLEPDHALAQAALALVLVRKGDARGALERAEAALARDPELALGHVARGEALRVARDPAARAAYDRALELDGRSALARLGRGLLHAAEGDAEEADHDLSKAVQLHPRLGVAWLERGLLRQSLGRDAAGADLALALEYLPPGSPEARRAERASAGR